MPEVRQVSYLFDTVTHRREVVRQDNYVLLCRSCGVEADRTLIVGPHCDVCYEMYRVRGRLSARPTVSEVNRLRRSVRRRLFSNTSMRRARRTDFGRRFAEGAGHAVPSLARKRSSSG